jgi:hypothetical protein
MNPLETKRGHFYYAVKCQNCKETLPLVEVPSHAEMKDFRDQLRDLTVRCPFCTQEMQVHERQVYFLEVR